MTNKNQRGLLDKIENLDRRVVYLIVMLAVMLPLIRPVGLPLNVAQETSDYYTSIANLPPDSKVLCKIDLEAGIVGELGPASVATLKQLWKMPVKMVFIFFYRGDAPVIFESVLLPQIPGYVDTMHIGDKVYGVDWVSLGYIEGHETAMAKLAADMHFVSLDQFGNSLASLPLMDNINTAGDFQLLIHVGGGDNAATLNQFATPYKLKAITATPGVDYVGCIPYYKSGLYSGILNSLKGAGEYEFLLGMPGLAIVASDSISATHVTLIVMIVIGNVIYIYRRRVSGHRMEGKAK